MIHDHCDVEEHDDHNHGYGDFIVRTKLSEETTSILHAVILMIMMFVMFRIMMIIIMTMKVMSRMIMIMMMMLIL